MHSDRLQNVFFERKKESHEITYPENSMNLRIENKVSCLYIENKFL